MRQGVLFLACLTLPDWLVTLAADRWNYPWLVQKKTLVEKPMLLELSGLRMIVDFPFQGR